MRFTNSYTTKKTTVSDTTKATVTASNSTINGTQTLSINKLAKSGYLTGSELSGASGSTKLSDLGFASETAGSVRISGNGVSKDLSLSKDMTIDDFVSQINDSGTGVKASYDSSNHRLFITSQKSGEDGDFTLTGLDENGDTALYKLGVNVASSTSSKEAAAWMQYADDEDGTATAADKIEAAVTAISNAKKAKEDAASTMEGLQSERMNNQGAVDYLTARKAYETAFSAADNSDDNAKAMSQLLSMSKEDAAKEYVLEDGNLRLATENDTAATKYSLTVDTEGEGDAAVTNYTFKKNGSNLGSSPITDQDTISALKNYSSNKSAKEAYEAAARTEGGFKATVVSEGVSKLSYYQGEVSRLDTEIQDQQDIIDKQNDILKTYATIDSDAITSDITETANADRMNEVVNSLVDKVTYFATNYTKQDDGSYVYSNKDKLNTDAKKVDGTDAEILLNGVKFKSDTNSFNINGLSIKAQAVTTDELTITTATDTDGIYNKFKDFLSEYNSLIKEMSTLYNASSSKGYEPLTSDEKYAMSDKEVEEWETKIKDSLLRKDSTLGSLISIMTNSMSSTVEIDGKKYGLSSLGIKTGSYFTTTAQERGMLHIDGDADDDTSSGNTDKLRAMLESDPDKAVDILKGITSQLYENLDKRMKRTSMRSAYTVYNDKEMSKNYSDYTKKIKNWDDKVASIEDSYYKKFAAMETALAKLQSQTQQMSGFFG